MAKFVYKLDLKRLEDKRHIMPSAVTHAGKVYKVDAAKPNEFVIETDTEVVEPYAHKLRLVHAD